MNFDRTDIFLISLPFLQMQILFQMVLHVGFDTFKSASNLASLSSISIAVIFLLGAMSALLGIQKAVDAFFDTSTDRMIQAKGAGTALLLSAFLLITLVVVARTYLY